MPEAITKDCTNCHFAVTIKMSKLISCNFFKSSKINRSKAKKCKMFLPINWWKYPMQKDANGNWYYITDK
jgi:hypothetical protein